MRILDRCEVRISAKGQPTCTIALHWRPVDAARTGYIEMLIFDGPTPQFETARAYYEEIEESRQVVPSPWSQADGRLVA